MRATRGTLAVVALAAAVLGTAPFQAEGLRVAAVKGNPTLSEDVAFSPPGHAGPPVASAQGGYHWVLPEDVIGFVIYGHSEE